VSEPTRVQDPKAVVAELKRMLEPAGWRIEPNRLVDSGVDWYAWKKFEYAPLGRETSISLFPYDLSGCLHTIRVSVEFDVYEEIPITGFDQSLPTKFQLYGVDAEDLITDPSKLGLLVNGILNVRRHGIAGSQGVKPA